MLRFCRQINRLAITAIVALGAISSYPVDAGEAQCEPTANEFPLDEAMGSVALMANLRGSADSIAVVAQSLLEKALRPQLGATGDCPANCDASSTAVIYQVAPSAYLAEPKQRRECVDYERETSANPLKFATERFASIDELNTWITRFSRGKGAQGKALYRACTSNCSPRYTFVIETQADGGYALTPQAICGLARDKRNSLYRLATSLRQHCQRDSAAETPHEK